MDVQANRAALVVMAKHHADADMLRSGSYGGGSGETFKACSVGCLAHEISPKRRDYHAVVAEFADAPEWLIRWQDHMFEALPADDRVSFHVDLAKHIAALPVGVDWDAVRRASSIKRLERTALALEPLLVHRFGHGTHEVLEQSIAAQHQMAAALLANDDGLIRAASAAAGAASDAALAASDAALAASDAALAARAAAWAASDAALAASDARDAAWAASVTAERDAMFACLDSMAAQE